MKLSRPIQDRRKAKLKKLSKGKISDMPVQEDFIDEEALVDDSFNNQLQNLLKHFSGRPTPLYMADRISKELGFNC